jgi:hypothetical protein
MCCFSQRVEHVSGTRIFARGVNGKQFLVYSMNYAAATDLAMILPLPVPPGSPDHAVRFINLAAYPTFFDDIQEGFSTIASRGLSKWLTEPASMVPVHEVGCFEASFVPRVQDFERLERRFRIPRDVWDHVPEYRDYGFAVFKLKAAGSGRGFFHRLLPGAGKASAAQHVHPMAFEFPRRNPDLLFFPTLHVHDGRLHPEATFDHCLFCQTAPEEHDDLQECAKSAWPAEQFVNIGLTQGIVDPREYCWRITLRGRLENKDTLLGKGGSVPQVRID